MSANGMKAKSAARKWKRLKRIGVLLVVRRSIDSQHPPTYHYSSLFRYGGYSGCYHVLWLKCYFDLKIVKHCFGWYYGAQQEYLPLRFHGEDVLRSAVDASGNHFLQQLPNPLQRLLSS